MTPTELVESHLQLPVQCAQRYLHRVLLRNPDVDVWDLVGDGRVGLVKAARNFKPELGVPFPPYAVRRITGEIIDGLRLRSKHRGWSRRAGQVSERATDVDLGRIPAVSISLDAPILHRELHQAALSLPPREYQVFTGWVSEVPIADTGRQLGISQARVSQLRLRVLERLRQEMA